MRLLNSVSIKYKLRGAFITIILLAATGGIISFSLLSKVAAYQETKHQVSRLVFLLSDARKAEKDFVAHGFKHLNFLNHKESDILRVFEERMAEVKSLLHTLKEDENVFELGLENEINFISTSILTYSWTFNNLVKLLYERGFKDHGLEGEMRHYVHGLQNCLSPEEKVYAFSLRRHEKDFVLRKDLTYSATLYETIKKFKSFVEHSDMPHMTKEYKSSIFKAIDAYLKHFTKIEKIEKEIGLNENEGLKGILNRKAEEVEPKVQNIYEIINSTSRRLSRRSGHIWFGSLALVLLAGAAFSFYLTRNISNPVIKLDEATQEILKNKAFDIEKELKGLHRTDEIGNLVQHFRQMILTMQEQWHTIKEKNDSLEKVLEDEHKRKWAMHGLNFFNDLLKTSNKNLKDLCKEVLGELVKYTNSNQGCIFLLNENQEKAIMQQMACYAYHKFKKADTEVEYGEGLVGQCWREADTIYMTDIPQEYIQIRSGLGSASPRSVLIVPVKFEDKVLGVLELASFKVYQAFEIAFVEQLADKMGVAILNLQMQEASKKLYAETQKAIRQMKEQKEAYEQHLEELSL